MPTQNQDTYKDPFPSDRRSLETNSVESEIKNLPSITPKRRPPPPKKLNPEAMKSAVKFGDSQTIDAVTHRLRPNI